MIVNNTYSYIHIYIYTFHTYKYIITKLIDGLKTTDPQWKCTMKYFPLHIVLGFRES